MRITTQAAFNQFIATPHPSSLMGDIIIDFNAIGSVPNNIQRFCAFLNNQAHQELNFSNQRWSDEVAAQIIQGLAANKTMTSLNLAGNHMGAQSIDALGGLLTTHLQIHTLNISDNPLGNYLWTLLNELLKGEHGVQHLVMLRTNESDQAHSLDIMKQLIRLSESHFCNILTLNISGNRFVADAKIHFERIKATAPYAHSIYSTGPTSSELARIQGVETCHFTTVPPSSCLSSTSTTSTTTTSQRLLTKFYGVSDKTTANAYFYSYPRLNDAVKVFTESTKFKVFSQLTDAQAFRLSNENKSAFFDTSFPVIFDLVVDAAIPERARIEPQHIVNAMFIARYERGTDALSSHLLSSPEKERLLREVFSRALQTYRDTMPKPTSSDAADSPGMCSTVNIERSSFKDGSHTQLGIDRAANLCDTLASLPYYEMMAAITSYINRPFTGNYDRDKSFKAILYVELLKTFGTPTAQAFDHDHSPEITKQHLIDLLATVNEALTNEVVTASVKTSHIPGG